MLDLVIRHGWVVDGTGNPSYPADVGILGDRIVEVGKLMQTPALRVIDATGKLVCPGFVDCHSHSDWTIHSNPTQQSTVRQGVTTEVVGNCGISNAPLTPLSRASVQSRLDSYCYPGPYTWSSFGDYITLVSQMKTSANVAWLVGHNTLRAAAGVSGTKPSKEQMQVMEDLLQESMDAGALGLSTGLEFEPGRDATVEEIVRLAKVAGRNHGYYASHIRNRDQYMQEAIDEFITIVRESGAIGEVSHLNVRHHTAPEGTWQRAVARLDESRKEGLNVLADTTPFLDGIGLMAAILPPWLRTETPSTAAALLAQVDVRSRLRDDCDRYWRFIARGEWQRVRLLTNKWFPELSGKSLPEIAEIWRKDEWDCYFDILAAAGAEMDSLLMIGLLFTEEHSADMVRHPLFSLAVDGYSSTVGEPLSRQSPHPINYAGMTHYLTHHVRARRNLRLEEAIRKMTSMPAGHFGLTMRGLILPGFYADVVVLDVAALDDVSVVGKPTAYVRGVDHVLINGVSVVANGEHTGARPGRNLLRA